MIAAEGRPSLPTAAADIRNRIMEQTFQEDKVFEKINFNTAELAPGEYENCTFQQCDFSGADLSGRKFNDCTFTDCNLSMVKTLKTAFREVRFKACKMLGILFYQCNEIGLSVQFEECNLSNSSFYKTKIKNTVFKNSRLQEVDFTDCDLSNAIFGQCDLLNAHFENTVLENADFRTAMHFSINPETNKLKKAKFSLQGLPGLLDKYGLDIDEIS